MPEAPRWALFCKCTYPGVRQHYSNEIKHMNNTPMCKVQRFALALVVVVSVGFGTGVGIGRYEYMTPPDVGDGDIDHRLPKLHQGPL